MAERLGDAVLELRTDDRDFRKGVDGARDSAQGLDGDFDKASIAAKAFAAAVVAAAAAAAAALVAMASKAVELADVQIQAEQQLGAALRLLQGDQGEALEGFREFAAGIQAVTTVGDEAVLSMSQVATSMGLTAAEAKTAVKEAVGLAAAFGIAEKSAIRYTAGLAQGDTTMLNRYIPTLRQVKDDAERVAKAHEILGSAFGVAVESAESGLGPWRQLQNLTGDLLETMGRLIIDAIRPLVGALKVLASSKEAHEYMETLGTLIGWVIGRLVDLALMSAKVMVTILDSWAQTFGQIFLFLNKLPAEVLATVPGLKKLRDVSFGLAGVFIDLRDLGQDVADALSGPGGLADAAEQAIGEPGSTGSPGSGMSGFNKVLQDAIANVPKLPPVFIKASAGIRATFTETGRQLFETLETSREHIIKSLAPPEAIVETEEMMDDWRQAFANAMADAIIDADSFADALDELFRGRIRAALTSLIDSMLEDFPKVWKSIKKGATETSGAWKNAGKDIGGTLNAIVAGFNAASGEMEDVMVGAMASITAFAQGNFVGGVIAAVGTIVGLVKNLFGGKKRVITKEFKAAMKDLREGTGAFLRDLLKASSLLVEVLSTIGRGTKARDALVLLNENFNDLVDSALRFGDAGIDSIARIVEAARQAGVDMTVINERLAEEQENALRALEERNQFILDQTAAVISSIEAMFTGLGRTTQRELEFAALAILQVFEAMRAAGLSVTEAFDQISNVVGLLEDRGQELSETLPDGFERLGEMLDILSNDKLRRVLERLEEMADITQAVGNLGLLTAEQFDIFGDRIDRAFRKLIKQGFTGEEALALLAPQLQLIRDLSQQYGFEIDKNTQKLIDQADAQGLLQDKGLTTEDILIRGFDRMLEALNRLIEALGGVPLAFESIGDAAERAGDRVDDEISRMERRLRRLGETEINFPFRGGGGIPFQGGSGGFLDFGSGQAAVLHGTEQVITAAEGVGIAEMVATAIRNAGGGTTGGDNGQGGIESVRAEVEGLRGDLAILGREVRAAAAGQAARRSLRN